MLSFGEPYMTRHGEVAVSTDSSHDGVLWSSGVFPQYRDLHRHSAGIRFDLCACWGREGRSVF